MPNTLITPTMIAKEALMQLQNNMVMGNLVHKTYKNEFVKVGNTVNIRKPVKFVVTDGAPRTNQTIVESNTSILVDMQKHVSWNFTSAELTMTIEQYSERYITPAVMALANKVDLSLCGLHTDLFNVVGTPGTVPADFAALALAGQRLDENCVPKSSRYLVLNPEAEWKLADGLKGVYQNEIVKSIIREAYLGRIGKFDLAGDQNIVAYAPGTMPSAGWAVNAQPAEGATSIAVKWTGGTLSLKKGDILTFATCNAVNPVSGADLGYLRQFVVTADITGTTPQTVAVYPSFTTTGAYKTCTTRPAADAAVVGMATTTRDCNLAFHKNCFAMVMLPMEMPESAGFKARESADNVSIRVIKAYDIENDLEIIRLDILFGVKTLYPELGVVLAG